MDKHAFIISYNRMELQTGRQCEDKLTFEHNLLRVN